MKTRALEHPSGQGGNKKRDCGPLRQTLTVTQCIKKVKRGKKEKERAADPC